MRQRARRLLPAAAAASGLGALILWLAPSFAPANRAATTAAGGASPDQALVKRGRGLFVEGCSSCHGLDARGIPDQGPSLRGVGAGAADFYLSTGRMPLSYPGEEPLRSKSRYDEREIAALVAYVASFGGPPIPRVNPESASLSRGQELFTSNCAGCHAISGAGGVATGAAAPPLWEATPTQVAEAVRTGPYLMPRFGPKDIDQADLDALAAYVAYAQDPDDAGGWSIGRIGPVPEGMVAWLLAGAALLLVARVIGERRRERRR
jgi:ubiquinol-cytochrome c reductase cytochrome c subunit